MSTLQNKVWSGQFDFNQATDLFTTRYTMDYGEGRNNAVEVSSQDHTFEVTYSLDFIIIIGKPSMAITKPEAPFFSNVTISLRHWQQPYAAKHIEDDLGFDLSIEHSDSPPPEIVRFGLS